MIKKIWFMVGLMLLLGACTPPQPEKKVRIAINPWPGYEFLYLASQKGFFADAGLNVEIVELSSLADVQRSYIQGRVDGFGSTVIEVVQTAGTTGKPLDIILVPDFSAGGDVIMGNASVNSIADLKGKRIGAEVGSLGMFILYAALQKHGLSLEDVTPVNVEQLEVEKAMQNAKVDAVVTYPPYSLAVGRLPGHKAIFDTTEIPGDVIDTVVLGADVVEDRAEWIDKFRAVWQRTLQYAKDNQAEAYGIMARREGVSVEEFTDALTGIQVLGRDKQKGILGSEQLKQNISKVCDVLKRSESTTIDCTNINDLVKGYVGNE